MSTLAQNLIALLLVAACVGYVGWQLFKTISFGRGKAGSCCAKGCDAHVKDVASQPATGQQFIDADLLRRPRRS